jgi:TatD DNase family protein
MLVDSHCHLDFPELAEDRADIIKRARAAGVSTMVTISTRVARFETYKAIAESDPDIWFTIGTHPLGANEEPDISTSALLDLAGHEKCIGIGEAGLDYFYDKVDRETAKKVFRTHIAASRISGLPLVIHARDADDDMIAVLKEESAIGAFPAILHCFSSTPALAEVGVALGLHISFSGIVTFKRSDELRAIAQHVPLDRLLVETDAPFLAPQAYRGKRNEPSYVVEAAKTLAEVHGLSFEAMLAQTTQNFFSLFKKAKRPQ